MEEKQIHNMLFDLYDYADHLANEIKPGNIDNEKYFLTLVYIEDFFDGIGRAEIRRTADDPSEALSNAHKRIDSLRKKISELRNEYDFDGVLESAGRRISTTWLKK